jgi:hypothetical protein
VALGWNGLARSVTEGGLLRKAVKTEIYGVSRSIRWWCSPES